MQTFKSKLLQLPNKLALNYRLLGSSSFIGLDLTFRLLGHLAKSNQCITEPHLQQIQQEIEELCLALEQTSLIEQSFVAGQIMLTDDFESSLRKFQQGETDKEALLQACWRLIWADRHLGVREYQLVHLWGFWLGWKRPDIEELGAPYRPIYISSSHKNALSELDVEANSTPEHIKQKYRKLLSTTHPDKIMGSGGNDAQVRKATQKTTKIREAYVLLRMLHGF